MSDKSKHRPGSPAMGALLRGWRERKALTQAQLAERAGLHIVTVQNLEAGRLKLGFPALKKLYRVFGAAFAITVLECAVTEEES